MKEQTIEWQKNFWKTCICQELWKIWNFMLLANWHVILPQFHRFWQKTWDFWVTNKGLYYSQQSKHLIGVMCSLALVDSAHAEDKGKHMSIQNAYANVHNSFIQSSQNRTLSVNSPRVSCISACLVNRGNDCLCFCLFEDVYRANRLGDTVSPSKERTGLFCCTV